MPIEYTTRVDGLVTAIGGNVVQTISWALIGHDGEYGAEIPFVTEIPSDLDPPLLVHADLTHDTACEWVQAHADAEAVEASKDVIAKAIDHQRAARGAEPDNPWLAKERVAAEDERQRVAAEEAEKAIPGAPEAAAE